MLTSLLSNLTVKAEVYIKQQRKLPRPYSHPSNDRDISLFGSTQAPFLFRKELSC